MTAAEHASITKMKDYTQIELSEQEAEAKLKGIKSDANEWFERGATVESPAVTANTTAISSQYAAGLWELQNATDKSKIPANIILAEKELEKWNETNTAKTETFGGSRTATIQSQMLNNIPHMTDQYGSFYSSF